MDGFHRTRNRPPGPRPRGFRKRNVPQCTKIPKGFFLVPLNSWDVLCNYLQFDLVSFCSTSDVDGDCGSPVAGVFNVCAKVC